MKNKKIKTVLIIFIVLLILVLCFNVVVYAAYALVATEVSYTKSNGATVSVKAALDELYKKVPTHEIGDEVTVGGEQFYVLDWNNDSYTVNLIAKYNLNSGGTAQDSSYSGDEFSSSAYWSGSFSSSPFNVNDISGYSSSDAIGKAKEYGRSKGAVSSRLLTYEEAAELNKSITHDSRTRNILMGDQPWGYGFKSYWLGSIGDGGDQVWVYDTYLLDNGYTWTMGLVSGRYYYYKSIGIRPVLTVLKSSLS